MTTVKANIANTKTEMLLWFHSVKSHKINCSQIIYSEIIKVFLRTLKEEMKIIEWKWLKAISRKFPAGLNIIEIA